jgi:uncharacterized cupin superfamily protein
VRATVDHDAAVGTYEVCETRRLAARVGRPKRLLLAEAALEKRAESLASAFGVDGPWPQLERRLVTYMPVVPTGKLGDPVAMLVLVIPDDLALHRVSVRRADGPAGADNGRVEAVNIFRAENVAGRIDVARVLGSTATAMFIYDLAPGQSSSPYHYEYEEEWLLVVDGTVVVRAPDGEHALERGDLVCFPAGAAGAHKLLNRSESPARALLFSSSRVPAVSVYPDSDKIGVWAGDEKNDLIFKRGTAVPWSDGEEGWEKAL